MLDIQITIKGDKVILEGLNQITKKLPGAVERGLGKSAMGIYAAAFKFLTGPGRPPVRLRQTTRFFTEEGPGGVVSAMIQEWVKLHISRIEEGIKWQTS